MNEDIILPDINPIIKDLLKKQRKEIKPTGKQYRCNACTEWFPEEETDLYKYDSSSTRRHRVCLECKKTLSNKSR